GAETWSLNVIDRVWAGHPCCFAGVGHTPFPSLAPPITLLVDGRRQTLVVCMVLDVAPPDPASPIWFSAGNGSAVDAFTYGPSLAMDGTWTSVAQLSLPSEELASWEPLVCHTGPRTGGRSRSTQPLQLSGEASPARRCPQEPPRGEYLEAGAGLGIRAGDQDWDWRTGHSSDLTCPAQPPRGGGCLARLGALSAVR
uniref:Pre T-cell antigen receptor alpha n=1 Tax=Oryctolagus cuniculus TaxID=9986 RepID=G1SKJ2_RABIT